MSSDWYKQLDLGRLDPATRLRVLRFAVEKHGRQRVRSVLGVSRVTLWRYLNGKQEIPDDKLLALFASGLVSRSEFESLVAASQRLRALGVLRGARCIGHRYITSASHIRLM